MGAGKYQNKFIHLTRTGTKETTYGQVEEVWTEVSGSQEYWGSLQPASANEQIAFGMRNHIIDCKIVLHGYVDGNIDPQDRLQDKDTNIIYELKGIWLGNNETIIAARTLTTAEYQA